MHRFSWSLASRSDRAYCSSVNGITRAGSRRSGASSFAPRGMLSINHCPRGLAGCEVARQSSAARRRTTFSRRYAEDPPVRRGAIPPLDAPLPRQRSRPCRQGMVSCEGASQAETLVLAVGGFDGGQAVAEEGGQAFLQDCIAERVLLAGIGCAVEQQVEVGGVERRLGGLPPA